jgi:hypothetical protein
MLIDFFLHLKERRLPVSTTEYLSLLEALAAGLANYSLNDFYALARICLVKNEAHYDKFDLAFGDYFRNISARNGADMEILPPEWLSSVAGRLLSAEDCAMLDIPANDKPHEEERLPGDEAEKTPDDSNLLIGNGGNSPLGQGGVHLEGIRIDGQSTGNRSAIKAWDSRQFQGLDDEVELGTRNIKMALRRLRKFAREGSPDELDLDGTIASTARNAGWLDLKMRPERRNKVKVLILFDTGGSMDSHIKQCEELFSAARTEFKHLEYFYFHNCISDTVWRYNGPNLLSYYPLHYLMHKYGKDYKLIVVGDASMSPSELSEAVEGYHQQTSQESGEVWLRRLLAHYRHAVWLNPEQERYWHLTESIQMLRSLMEHRMYPLTLGGIDQAMKRLSK